MDKIGNRYFIDQPIFLTDEGGLYNGKDPTLQRDVFLYVIEAGKANDRDYLRKVGEVSSFVDERFMHIMDVGSDDTRFFAVMNHCEGSPLLHILEHHNLTVDMIFSLIYDLGQGLLEVMEERAVEFSVSAENIWISNNQLKIINYWSQEEYNRRGTRGLCYLLYQLCVRSYAVPASEEVYGKSLWAALGGLRTERKEALIKITLRAIGGDDSLASFMQGLRVVLESDENGENHTAAVTLSHSDSPEPKSRFALMKWVLLPVSLVSAAFLFGYIWGWTEDAMKSQSAKDPAVIEQADIPPNASQDAAKPAEERDVKQERSAEGNSTEENSEAISGPNDEGVTFPNLVGLTQEEAEKRAISAGFRYKFFLEFNKEDKGLVFKQDPEPGTPAMKGDRVTFWVSKGH
jgi:serine/threonine protein kinase